MSKKNNPTKHRKYILESDTDSDDSDSCDGDDDLPMMKSNKSTLFSGNGSKSFENNNSFYPDCFFVLSELSKAQTPERYKMMYEFGTGLTSQATKQPSIRKSLRNDSKGNILIILLMDTIGFQPPEILITQRKLFQSLFPSKAVLATCGDGTNKAISRHVVTTGEIRAILTGMVLSRSMNYAQTHKWRSYFETLSSQNLSVNEAFVCAATVLLELFLYNNVEVKPSESTGVIGLFSNGNYRYKPTKNPEDGQRICCGLCLPTTCLSTLNDLYLCKEEKSQRLISNRAGTRGNQVRKYWKYKRNKNNRGIFGVVYCCNSSRQSLVKPTKETISNVHCIAFGSVRVNTMEEVESVFHPIKSQNKRTCELCYLTTNTEIHPGDELVWCYDWERVRIQSDGSLLVLTKLEQMDVPSFSK